MSYLMFGNLPISVPKVFDTTPCMEQQDIYEECVSESGTKHLEVIHPNWPVIWPRLLTDGSIYPLNEQEQSQSEIIGKIPEMPISKKVKQLLWECEYERFVFKACLRKVIGLERTEKQTSWNTAEVANLQFT